MSVAPASTVAKIHSPALSPSPVTAMFAPPSVIDATNPRMFDEWLAQSLARSPEATAVSKHVVGLVEKGRVTTIRGLLGAALEGAKSHLANRHLGLPAQEREHLTVQVAMLALAPIATARRSHPTFAKVPPFLQDGRKEDAGHDKTRHFLGHAVLCWQILSAQRYGRGDVAAALTKAIAQYDETGAGRAVAAEYDRRRGAIGAMLTSSRPVPTDGAKAPYSARPVGLDAFEQSAYEETVRLGDSYEWVTADRPPLKLIGAPAGTIDTRASTKGLSDPAAVRDLTANRLGAATALALFKAPTVLPPVPFDGATDAHLRPLR